MNGFIKDGLIVKWISIVDIDQLDVNLAHLVSNTSTSTGNQTAFNFF